MRIEPRYSSVIVRLFGEFDPQELTPKWFAQHDLLPRDMTDAAEVVEESGSILFTTDWLRFWADSESMNAETPQAPYIQAFDLVNRAFREHLFRTTRLTAFSISRNALYFPSDVEVFDRIARTLVTFDEHPVIDTDGANSRDGDAPGSVVVMQENQDNIALLHLRRTTDPFMIGVEFTEKHVSECNDPGESKELVQMLGRRFDDFVCRADKAIERTMSSGTSEKD